MFSLICFKPSERYSEKMFFEMQTESSSTFIRTFALYLLKKFDSTVKISSCLFPLPDISL